jgi:hypothetical protein
LQFGGTNSQLLYRCTIDALKSTKFPSTSVHVAAPDLLLGVLVSEAMPTAEYEPNEPGLAEQLSPLSQYVSVLLLPESIGTGSWYATCRTVTAGAELELTFIRATPPPLMAALQLMSEEHVGCSCNVNAEKDTRFSAHTRNENLVTVDWGPRTNVKTGGCTTAPAASEKFKNATWPAVLQGS